MLWLVAKYDVITMYYNSKAFMTAKVSAATKLSSHFNYETQPDSNREML